MAQRPNQEGRGRRRWWGALGGTLSYWLWRRWRSGSSSEPGAVRQHSLERGHEGDTTNVPGVLIASVLVVLLVAVSVWGVVEFIDRLERGGAMPDAGPSGVTAVDLGAAAGVPPPRLQADPAVDLQAFHRYENRRLYTYGRVDSSRLHIPIGQAMKLIDERGLPADSSAQDDSMRVPTESGFRIVHRTFPNEPPPYLGSSPERYTPAPAFRRSLTEEGYLPRPDSAR